MHFGESGREGGTDELCKISGSLPLITGGVWTASQTGFLKRQEFYEFLPTYKLLICLVESNDFPLD